MRNPTHYLIRIENAKKIISEYGINETLTENSLKGLDELQEDFIHELSKEAKSKV